jgi:hypothetical protein
LATARKVDRHQIVSGRRIAMKLRGNQRCPAVTADMQPTDGLMVWIEEQK